MGVLDRLWTAIGDSLFGGTGSGSASTEAARQSAQSNALVVWLLGKTGAGKTAIVAALTGDPRAEVGLGFEPCTATSSFYDVPPEAPLLRFLDTRGLGEASYDPSSDISWCEEQSHLLLVVMQAIQFRRRAADEDIGRPAPAPCRRPWWACASAG